VIASFLISIIYLPLQRYMSPEIVQCKPYNQATDVFSFGVLLFELLSLNRLSTLKGSNRIVDTADIRACSCWPDSLHKILLNALSPIISKRPTMHEFCKVLRDTISELKTIMHSRKRSRLITLFVPESLTLYDVDHTSDSTISSIPSLTFQRCY
jgi:serine/threonine protein kinase